MKYTFSWFAIFVFVRLLYAQRSNIFNFFGLIQLLLFSFLFSHSHLNLCFTFFFVSFYDSLRFVSSRFWMRCILFRWFSCLFWLDLIVSFWIAFQTLYGCMCVSLCDGTVTNLCLPINRMHCTYYMLECVCLMFEEAINKLDGMR